MVRKRPLFADLEENKEDPPPARASLLKKQRPLESKVEGPEVLSAEDAAALPPKDLDDVTPVDDSPSDSPNLVKGQQSNGRLPLGDSEAIRELEKALFESESDEESDNGSGSDSDLEAALSKFGRPTAFGGERPAPFKKEEEEDEGRESKVNMRESESEEEERNGRVWYDESGDENEINLSAHPKLRKLQKFGKDHSVSEREYEKRLLLFHTSRTDAANWLEKLRGGANALPSDDSDSTDSEGRTTVEKVRLRPPPDLLRSTNPLVEDGGKARPDVAENKLTFKLRSDVNQNHTSRCTVDCAGFLPLENETFVYSAGKDKTVSLFEYEEQSQKFNLKSSAHLSGLPIKRACVFPSHLVFLSRKKTVGLYEFNQSKMTLMKNLTMSVSSEFTYFFDVVSRNVPHANTDFALLADNGHILLSELRSQSLTSRFKMNDQGTVLCFDPCNTHRLYSGDEKGKVYEWDLRSSSCVESFQDEGSTKVTSLAAGYPHCPYLAVGSPSGYLNLYDTKSFYSDRTPVTSSLLFTDDVTPTSLSSSKGAGTEQQSNGLIGGSPMKSFGNLTTDVTSISFNPSLPMIAYGSSMMKDAVKMINGRNLHVYKNFPNARNEGYLKYVRSIAFSPDGKLMIVGNDHGKLRLFQF